MLKTLLVRKKNNNMDAVISRITPFSVPGSIWGLNFLGVKFRMHLIEIYIDRQNFGCQ